MPGPSTPDDRPTTRGEGRMNDFEFDFRLPTCDLTGYRKKEKGKRKKEKEEKQTKARSLSVRRLRLTTAEPTTV